MICSVAGFCLHVHISVLTSQHNDKMKKRAMHSSKYCSGSSVVTGRETLDPWVCISVVVHFFRVLFI